MGWSIGTHPETVPDSARSKASTWTQVNDVTHVDAVADRAFVEHHKSSVMFNVDCHARQLTSGKLNSDVSAECDERSAISVMNIRWERIETAQQYGEYGRWFGTVADPRGTIRCPLQIEPQANDD